jgi:thymidylate kinase
MLRSEAVYIEGLPASGKTTLIGRMALRFPDALTTIGEYVHPEEATAALANNDETYFMRNDTLKHDLARSATRTCLVDRGHLSTVLYNKAHQAIYGQSLVDVDTWYADTILGEGKLPDVYIHLDTDPLTSLKRRPPAENWLNMWDDPQALAIARQGYRDYMEQFESEVPVLRLPADQMNFAEIDQEVSQFLLNRYLVTIGSKL